MADMTWLAQEAKNIHGIFHSFFYVMCLFLLTVGIVFEYLKWPLGQMPSFAQMVGRMIVAAILLQAYPEITNSIAEITDAISKQLGDMNNFHLVLDRMGEKLSDFSWSWSSFKDMTILVISFLTFFLLYFSVHIADAFYLYAWTLLYVFSPLLIALYILPATASATHALFKSLIEVASWKIVWSVLATLLWSQALSTMNHEGSNISFLTAISFNIILAGSLLLTPFVVHALAGAGISNMTKDIGALAIGGLALSPGTALSASKSITSKAASFGKEKFNTLKDKMQIRQAVNARKNAPKSNIPNYALNIKANKKSEK